MVRKGESTLTSHCLVWKQGFCGSNWEWSRMREPKRDGLWAEAPHSGTSLGQRNLEDGLLIMKNPRSTGKYCLKLTKELWKWKVWRFTEVPPSPIWKKRSLKRSPFDFIDSISTSVWSPLPPSSRYLLGDTDLQTWGFWTNIQNVNVSVSVCKTRSNNT